MKTDTIQVVSNGIGIELSDQPFYNWNTPGLIIDMNYNKSFIIAVEACDNQEIYKLTVNKNGKAKFTKL